MIFTYRYPRGKKPGDLWFELEKPFSLPTHEFMPHKHEYMELTLVTHGTGWHRISDLDHSTAPGEVIIVPPGVVHSFYRSRKQTHRNFHFDPALLNDLRRDAKDLESLTTLFNSEIMNPEKYSMARLRLTPKELAIAEQISGEIENEQDDYQPGRFVMTRLSFQRLILFIARIYANRQMPSTPDDSGLSRTLEYLSHNLLKPINLGQLAEIAGMSSSHFRRLFRKAFGDSPINYLIRLRIRMACSLLEKSALPVTEIAFRCGFKDSNYFTRQFTKVMGSNPRRYRQLFPRK
jgi:AraC-like DNA-binding protein